MIEAKPENLIGDKAYDGYELDASLKKQGVEMIAPHPRAAMSRLAWVGDKNVVIERAFAARDGARLAIYSDLVLHCGVGSRP